MATPLGCQDGAPACRDVVAIGAYSRWAALLKSDGSAWTWRPGIEPTEPATKAPEHLEAARFSNAGMCLKLATGDMTCSLLPDGFGMTLPNAPVEEVSLWSGPDEFYPNICAVLPDETLTCNLPDDGVGEFKPIAQGMRHVSFGESICAITNDARLVIPWQLVEWVPGSGAAASFPDVAEAVAFPETTGCVARTAGGQIAWIHEIWRSDDPSVPVGMVADQIPGFDGQVSQLITGQDFAHSHYVCALQTDGKVSCMGDDAGGGWVAPHTDAWVPVKVRLPRAATALAGGPGYACALLQDRTVWCWGLGYGTGASVRC